MEKIKILILAGGLGKRMNNPDLPKVLVPLKNKYLITYLLEAIEQSQVDSRPVIVVGKKADLVKEALGDKYDYIFQPEQLGTAHAVGCAQDFLKDKAENILVLYGDQPLLLPQTIRNIIDKHLSSQTVLTMGTVVVPDFDSWRAGFYDFGRIIRDKNNKVIGIKEKKDADKLELEIKELNPSYFCFKADWLWASLKKISNQNNQKEYYLTDLIQIAVSENEIIETVEVLPKEAVGINSVEQLKLVEGLI